MNWYRYGGDLCEKHWNLDKWLRNNYGITLGRYEQMLKDQGGGCAMCGFTPGPGERRLAVDHDHACCSGTKSCGLCVRGLLCFGCNSRLGHLEDGMFIRSALDYFDQFGGGIAWPWL